MKRLAWLAGLALPLLALARPDGADQPLSDDPPATNAPPASAPATNAAVTATNAPAMNLSGPVWRLKEWESGGKTEAVPKGIEITASIRDGRISGRSACNSYFGSCEWSSNGTLRISRVAATQMACEADVMRWESRYTSALEKLDGWSISDSVLTLDAEGKEQLRFRSAPSKR